MERKREPTSGEQNEKDGPWGGGKPDLKFLPEDAKRKGNRTLSLERGILERGVGRRGTLWPLSFKASKKLYT